LIAFDSVRSETLFCEQLDYKARPSVSAWARSTAISREDAAGSRAGVAAADAKARSRGMALSIGSLV
jgi:hypothetical protein